MAQRRKPRRSGTNRGGEPGDPVEEFPDAAEGQQAAQEPRPGQPRAQQSRDAAGGGQPEEPEGAAKHRPRAVQAAQGYQEFLLVGIGASAGGLKPLKQFFAKVPPASNMAFVVVQHLDPRHGSLLDSILGQVTHIKVVNAADGMRVQPNRIYIKPPDSDLLLVEDKLVLLKPLGTESHMPIDVFFRSLAEQRGENCCCIVLSGTGRDGTLGLKAVKGAGGLTLVQSEDEAEYTGMPTSAIDTGMADLVLRVEEMPRELIRFARHPFMRPPAAERDREPGRGRDTTVQKILATVRSRTGHDFTHYKRSTVRRRIDRRMVIHHIDGIDDYLNYLRKDEGEVQALFKDLTINVTRFFRDPEAFEELKAVVKRHLIPHKNEGSDLRAWVAGCSTGEEAYSLAMVLTEAMIEADKHLNIKVFGTDINPDAVESARSGIYPDTIAADIDPARLERFFVRSDTSYRVRDGIRETLIFAVHDVPRDPPFSQLDLVSCRNLLIYVDHTLQKRILPYLYYSLVTGGVLFLGTSEGVGDFADLFSPVSTKWKIFRGQHADPERYLQTFHVSQVVPERRHPGAAGGGGERERTSSRGEVRRLVERTIMERYGPPAVLVDENFDILYFHGDTQPYLVPPQGEPQFNLLRMARREVHYRLRKILLRAQRTGRQAVEEGVRIGLDGRFLMADLAVIPFKERRKQYLLVTFHQRTPPPDVEVSEPEEERDADSRVRALQVELYATRQDLQATIEELETSNEELKSANEELQANNEELQSTNEELETSREELQSTNEELETVNAELENKNQALSRASDDIQNLLAATNLATIFLDTELRINRFTPSTRRVFNLIEADIGRQLSDISTRLQEVDVAREAREVLDSLERREHTVRVGEDGWYLLDVRPYRTANNVIAGVVLTFIDFTERKKEQIRTEEALLYAENVMETVRQPLVVLTGNMEVSSANRSFYHTFRLTPKEAEGRSLFQLGAGEWDILVLRSALEQVLPEGRELADFRVELDFPQIGRRVLNLNARRIERGGGRPDLILLAVEDTTDHEKGGAGEST